jgi:hypothetical protein
MRAVPTRWQAVVFRVKAWLHQLRRFLQDRRGGLSRHGKSDRLTGLPVMGCWTSELRSHEVLPARELELQEGKVRNLTLAATLLDGVEVPAGAVWSFWMQLGRATRRRGFAEGRELREGCIIPQIGGGLCQLSGALYNAALEAGLEIVERHAHSHPGVGSLARIGRDATVFWNYVDLRFRSPQPWRLEVAIGATHLEVRIRCAEKGTQAPLPVEPLREAVQPLNSCATCGVGSCHRSE